MVWCGTLSNPIPNMTHQEKVALSIAELKAKGLGQSTSAPPLWRLFWKLGLEIRPPLYMSFAGISSFLGSFFAIFWGSFMWFAHWKNQGMPSIGAIVAALGAGALFGSLMAAYYKWKARKLGLTSWEDLGKNSR